MKSIYQQIWCIGFLLEGEFIRAEVISLRIHTSRKSASFMFRYFLWTTKSEAIDVLFLP